MDRKKIRAFVFLFLASILMMPPLSGEISLHPWNQGTVYEYDYDNPPDTFFFPVKKAKWNGYKVTNYSWMQLTAQQKSMFVEEGLKEIERKDNASLLDINEWDFVGALNNAAESGEKNLSEQYVMILVLHEFLNEHSLLMSPTILVEKIQDVVHAQMKAAGVA